MAEKLGLTPLAGSDAHFSTANWFLTCATELDREVATVEELCVELRGTARVLIIFRTTEPRGLKLP